jgi:hypothetical protein
MRVFRSHERHPATAAESLEELSVNQKSRSSHAPETANSATRRTRPRNPYSDALLEGCRQTEDIYKLRTDGKLRQRHKAATF